MAVQIQMRRDTAANWTSENPTLSAGEIGVETDTGRVKIGDGATAWTSLTYRFVNFYDAVVAITAVGDMGAAHTFDLSVTNQYSFTVSQAATISLTDPGINCMIRLRITKDATATARALTWQKTGGGGTFLWANNTVLASLTENAGVYDVILWRVAADTYDCSYATMGF